MVDISLNFYDDWRNRIRKFRNNNVSWEAIKYGNRADEAGLADFIHIMVTEAGFGDGVTDLPIDVWYRIVESEKTAEEDQKEIEERTRKGMLEDSDWDNNLTIATAKGSAWQLYRKHLKEDSHFSEESVKEIEASCFHILKKLSNDTTKTGPIKGLVIGNVQSGKTANMAGLMAMAADSGWNIFIILSGTIENLRMQTETRLNKDLNSGMGNLIWIPLERENLRLRKNGSHQQTKDLVLGDDSKRRYFAVCLKNKTRLRNLIKWLQGDKNAQQNLRILVIDDEADQASINTGDVFKGDEDRKAINKLIVNLVEGKKENSQPCESHYRAMDYVCYTATPYANFLNENYPTSLYPKDFLISLQPSRQYFGPTQIFGTEEEENNDGMNIVRPILKIETKNKRDGEVDDFDLVKDIHDNGSLIAPDSFVDSIAWFICATAAMRYNGFKKPISMLVHTSTIQNHHANFANVIKVLLAPSNRNKLMQRCREVYARETKAFSKADLRKAYPNYERSESEIDNYPEFSEIQSGIELLLDTPVTAIPMNEDHDEMQYHAGIHLCIDNCSNNGVNSENMHVRLVYPADDLDPYPTPAPAFIVVGGNTLSRGLTIQGLVSTYFARDVRQADSLMQMARWFGYRKHYELYPRIWMADKTKEKFEFMTQLDCELREELEQFSTLGKKPLEYGPRVKNTPKASFLQITAKNRMHMAETVDMDFTGVRTETITFPNNKESLEGNIDVVTAFLKNLPDPEIARRESGYIWRNVDFSVIKKQLLNKCNFATEGKVFNQLDVFLNWIDKVTKSGSLTTWNVAVAGGVCDIEDDKAWNIFGEYSVRKINRNNKFSNNNSELLAVGAVRDPKDLVIDIDDEELQKANPEVYSKLDTKSYIINNHYLIRSACGYDKTPLLIVYMIDKDSTPKDSKSTTRKALNAKADVVAFSITIPGTVSGQGIARKLQIKPYSVGITEDEDEQ